LLKHPFVKNAQESKIVLKRLSDDADRLLTAVRASKPKPSPGLKIPTAESVKK